MKKSYATEVDRIIAGIQSRTVSRRYILAQAELQYTVAREHAKKHLVGDVVVPGNREAGKLGKAIRREIKPLAADQKLDYDTMKLLRKQSRHLDKIITQVTVAANILNM